MRTKLNTCYNSGGEEVSSLPVCPVHASRDAAVKCGLLALRGLWKSRGKLERGPLQAAYFGQAPSSTLTCCPAVSARLSWTRGDALLRLLRNSWLVLCCFPADLYSGRLALPPR